MDQVMDKSVSDSEINVTGTYNKTPPNYVFQRTKRTREEMDDSITDQLADIKANMEKMMTLITTNRTKQVTEFQEINTTLKEIQLSNNNIECSVAFLAAQNEQFKSKIDQLENQLKEDKKYILLLEDKIEDMQRGNRKNNFEMKNVPKKNNETKEDLVEMVINLSHNIGCKIEKLDIKDIYRTRGKNSEKQNTPIVVETGSTLLKSEILKKGKDFNIRNKSKLCAKHLGFKVQEDTPIFLSEHLTQKGSRLFFLARDLAKSNGYKFCWTSYGNVYVRKDEHSPIVIIRSEEQVHQLLLKK